MEKNPLLKAALNSAARMYEMADAIVDASASFFDMMSL